MDATHLNPDAFPVSLLHHYDNVDAAGDDGYTQERLEREIRASGRVEKRLEVAHSKKQLAKGDQSIYVFNGNHRLLAARNLRIQYVPVVSHWRSEDAVPVKGIPNEFGEAE
jgi:hypothetical protein